MWFVHISKLEVRYIGKVSLFIDFKIGQIVIWNETGVCTSCNNCFGKYISLKKLLDFLYIMFYSIFFQIHDFHFILQFEYLLEK